jgi:endogenous inhibitor of DNA gyrase (YacG/DUF329 family)
MTCPNCGRKLEHLVSVEETIEYYDFNGTGYTNKQTHKKDIQYECPYCATTLASSEEEARKILGVK